MNRFLATLRWDIALQFRNGFYYAGLFITILWIGVLRQLPTDSLSLLVPALLLLGMQITTFYFIAGLVLLEKSEGSLTGLVVTPLRDREYLASKVASLTLLAMLEETAVVYLGYGAPPMAPWLLLGMLFVGALYTLIGFMVIARYDSINEFLMPSMIPTLLLTLPLLDYFNIWPNALFYLHPIQPALLLMQAAFVPIPTWQLVYGLLAALLWVGLCFFWAQRSFQRFVVRTAGD